MTNLGKVVVQIGARERFEGITTNPYKPLG